jgi:hypothetical protein
MALDLILLVENSLSGLFIESKLYKAEHRLQIMSGSGSPVTAWRS